MLGVALQGRRDDVVVATKFGMDMQGRNGPDHGARASRRYLRRAVEASLKRLGTDHIDLYQLHQPDLVTPVEETLDALAELVAEGKVLLRRLLQLRRLGGHRRRTAPPASAGSRASSPRRTSTRSTTASAEDELVPACLAAGVSVLPYFPLAYGLLTGKYERGADAPDGHPARPRRAAAPARGR